MCLPGDNSTMKTAQMYIVKLCLVTMSTNRFEQLMSVFHISDNMKLNKSDKMAKIRHFMT